jgi:hypothetical protein|tara:strand:- start:2550 stop:2672 length:123 start_codon:yes stop_codon:yes gene_type:complete
MTIKIGIALRTELKVKKNIPLVQYLKKLNQELIIIRDKWL